MKSETERQRLPDQEIEQKVLVLRTKVSLLVIYLLL